MGLYSVFLALGQIIGAVVAGVAADWRGIDGLLIASAGLLVVAIIPLGQLRALSITMPGHEDGAGRVGRIGILGGQCASAACSSPPSATTRPMPRWCRTGSSCAPDTSGSSDRGSTASCPLGFAVSQRVEQVIREEMNAIGGQEMEMPVVHPPTCGRRVGSLPEDRPRAAPVQGPSGRDMVLAMTHEEVVTDLLRDIVKSYRQLPAIVYHFQTKFRDEPRSRGGLIRVREFVMKDSYTLDARRGGLDHGYQLHYQAYEKIFARLGLETVVVGADVGIMGGSLAHEFMVLNEHGEDTLVLCDALRVRRQPADRGRRQAGAAGEEPRPTEEVATPEADTIASLAALLGVGTDRTAKATFFVTGDGRLVTAIVRGDFEVNETKLANAVKAIGGLRPAHPEEITAAGMEPGYASPIGAHDTVVVDDLAARSPNLVAGANRHGYHLLNVNHGRDYSADLVVDIPNAREGDPCPQCGAPVVLRHGIEVGNIFKLGTDFTESSGRDLPRRGRQPALVMMGSYGIGLGRAWPASSRSTTTRRGSSGPARARRTRRTWSRSAR